MKIKNSYILLISIAIFLLISIGSVCASDDLATDDVTLTSTESDDILANESGDDGDSVQEKINTTINADNNKKYNRDETDKNISVTVKDNESQEITLTKKNLTVYKNKTEIDFEYNNSIITITEKLSVGEHNLTITYLGNSEYNSSSISIILRICTDNELEVPETVDSDGTSAEIPIKLTDGIDDNTNLINHSNTNITDKNGAPVNWEIINNTIKITAITTVPTTITINYTENGKSLIKEVNIRYKTKINTNTTLININEGEKPTINVNVTNLDGNILNITRGNLTIAETSFDYNETTGNLIINNLKKGIHNLTITYKGNNIYNASHVNILINVRGAIDINTNVTEIQVNSTKKGEVKITITNGVDNLDFTKDNITILNVTYKDGNVTKTIPVTEYDVINGTVYFKLENGNFSTANITISYNNGVANKTIKINRIYNAAFRVNITENEYKDGSFTVILIDLDDNNATLANKDVSLSFTSQTITTGFTAKTDENGVASFKTRNIYIFDQRMAMKELEVGTHEAIYSTKNTPVKTTELKLNLTITKANIKITIDPYKEYYGSSKKVTITVTNTKSGEPVPGIILHLYMPQTTGKDYYFQTNINGTTEIAVSGLVGGTYDLTLNNNDTVNINNTTAKGKITILQIPVTVSLKSSLSIYYNSGSTATIKVTDKSTGKALAGVIILVQIDGKTSTSYLFQTNSKGTVTFASSLAVGKHKMVISTADTRYKGNTLKKTLTVKKASAKITARKVTDYYKGVKYLTIKLTNTKNKKGIYNAKLNIKIYISKNRYYNYNGKTGANGVIKLALNTLKPKTYKVVVSGADSKSFTAKKVTTKIVIKKAPTKLIPKKLTAKKGAKKYFKVTVKNKKTKKVISKVKVKIKVYTGKKAKTYTAKTNTKGIAKISTKKLKVGRHKVIVTSANKYCVAKKAKSTIKIKK